MPKGLHDDRYRELISRLVEQRLRLGLRQEDVAQRLGVEQYLISRMETGQRRLDIVEFADIARALQMDIADIASGIPPR